jgi:hypothetical protein
MVNYNNHLSQGHREVTFKNKKVTTSINSDNFNANMSRLRLQNGTVGVIPPGYEHRADKIADLFYGSPTLDWVVLWTNNISDPFEQLNVGDRIKIISLS